MQTVISIKVVTDFLSVVALSALMWPTLARRYFLVASGTRLLQETSVATETHQGTKFSHDTLP